MFVLVLRSTVGSNVPERNARGLHRERPDCDRRARRRYDAETSADAEVGLADRRRRLPDERARVAAAEVLGVARGRSSTGYASEEVSVER